MLINLQKKLIKIINKNKFGANKNPLSIAQIFALEALSFNYEDLRAKLEKKTILIPKREKSVSNKNSYIRVIKLFNKLPNDLKNLTKNVKNKLKDWIIRHIF